mmetsp:Transcript_136892/g.437163  ORF Transcript_136892/g.437163 Transcript_136892/m.437163 type:complete len:138 (-) Transcript_136892:111-524(-)
MKSSVVLLVLAWLHCAAALTQERRVGHRGCPVAQPCNCHCHCPEVVYLVPLPSIAPDPFKAGGSSHGGATHADEAAAAVDDATAATGASQLRGAQLAPLPDWREAPCPETPPCNCYCHCRAPPLPQLAADGGGAKLL